MGVPFWRLFSSSALSNLSDGVGTAGPARCRTCASASRGSGSCWPSRAAGPCWDRSRRPGWSAGFLIAGGVGTITDVLTLAVLFRHRAQIEQAFAGQAQDSSAT